MKYFHKKFMDIARDNSQCSMSIYYKENIHTHLTYTIAPHLNASIPTRTKQAICKLHLSSHRLQCEMGRWAPPEVPLEERICEVCDAKVVEDEIHTSISCSALNSERVIWLGNEAHVFKNVEEIRD
eukprot:c44921_g1_i1 orf=3-380(-)